MVVFNVFRFDRAESTNADVQRDKSDFHTFITDFLEQFRRKVQPRSRRGGGTEFFGINGLIAFAVFKLFRDIMRQRHFTDFFEHRENRVAFIGEFCKSVAVFQNA